MMAEYKYPCRHYGCPALIPRGQGYCAAHTRPPRPKRRDTRPSSTERGYGVRYRAVRAKKLKQCPWCEADWCGAVANTTHHIMPVSAFDNPDDAHYIENMMSLCAACHNKVEEGG